ncbi:hypothetical protein [Oryza sativa Japonica Group]|uniref:Uncharacterized protein n=2 Tax=Oryza sativa subsp. japonica TaxID=39947 RepID=A0A0P0V2N9_ORYSJ|nr:hypothetical protein [Oryza sativa Japonica Group]BAD68905.1 hypothetical protein [Oryza sativa Japonica Group]BAS72218.1 Os01g0378501 [Oryza sativa Japonica Group]
MLPDPTTSMSVNAATDSGLAHEHRHLHRRIWPRSQVPTLDPVAPASIDAAAGTAASRFSLRARPRGCTPLQACEATAPLRCASLHARGRLSSPPNVGPAAAGPRGRRASLPLLRARVSPPALVACAAVLSAFGLRTLGFWIGEMLFPASG